MCCSVLCQMLISKFREAFSFHSTEPQKSSHIQNCCQMLSSGQNGGKQGRNYFLSVASKLHKGKLYTWEIQNIRLGANLPPRICWKQFTGHFVCLKHFCHLALGVPEAMQHTLCTPTNNFGLNRGRRSNVNSCSCSKQLFWKKETV